MTLGANDFVLTPNGCWHEHGVEADGLPCIWQDGLDIPLVNALEAGFYAVHPDLTQAITHPVNDAVGIWGGRGLKPTLHDRSEEHTLNSSHERLSRMPSSA